MKKIIISSFVLCICVLLISWGSVGHKTIGSIAEKHLTPQAKASIAALLGNESLTDVANWAIQVRDQQEYKHTASWHYINVSDGLDCKQFSDEVEHQTSENACQAIYKCEGDFISGYTTKIAGTEEGVAEPQATFSACFGAHFLPLNPHHCAGLLKNEVESHNTRAWQINTSWTGGPYGIEIRISIACTMVIITAVLDKKLDNVPYLAQPTFGIAIPQLCPGGISGTLKSMVNKGR